MPLGFYPVTVGLDPRITWKDNGDAQVPPLKTKAGAIVHHFTCIGGTPIYDVAFIPRCPKVVRLEIASALVRAGNALPKSYRDNGDLKKWIETLKSDTESQPILAED